CQQGYNTPVTF
nr:immunoglobulin light chain junction region [Macaca mulatta]MOV78409.1 immunoglobulin light chain junction region [Macaca mulatta]MOV86200.1 immunoglobulin light chain junction region [Macaca mulatta]